MHCVIILYKYYGCVALYASNSALSSFIASTNNAAQDEPQVSNDNTFSTISPLGNFCVLSLSITNSSTTPCKSWAINPNLILDSGSSNKWWIDEIYDVIVAGFMFLFRFTWKAFEVIIIEGFIINGICWRGTEFVGEVLKVQQSGKLQNYVLVMISAAMLMVAWFIYN